MPHRWELKHPLPNPNAALDAISKDILQQMLHAVFTHAVLVVLVCLSHGGMVSKRLNVWSCIQRHVIAQAL